MISRLTMLFGRSRWPSRWTRSCVCQRCCFHFIECGANTGMEWGNVAVLHLPYTPHAQLQRIHRAEDPSEPWRVDLQRAATC
jgi:hypothetical protein